MIDYLQKANHYFAKGNENFANGDYLNSIKDLIYAEQIFSTHGNNENAANSLYILSIVYSKIGQLDQSFKITKQAYFAFKNLKDNEKIAECALNLGNYYRERGKIKESKQFLVEAIDLFIESKNFEKLADSWKSLGLTYQTDLMENSEHPSHIVNAYKTAIEFYKKGKSNKKQALTEFDLGQVLLSHSENNESIRYLTSAYHFFSKQNDFDYTVTLSLQLGRMHLETGKKSKAKHFFNQGLTIMKKNGIHMDSIEQLQTTINSLNI
ncbi:MAG: tetratricopeptide repeat protein [Candidatus Heimdallarchaeota archaeon]|nr:tetratricopeptide repeat protein [Candidatus Heimdallarchaeota archaeon]